MTADRQDVHDMGCRCGRGPLATNLGHRHGKTGRGSAFARAARAAAALVCALVVGCGGQPRLISPDQLSPATQAVAPHPALTAPATPGAAAPSIGEVVWVTASDPATNAPLEIVTTYAPNAPRITASVLISALPVGTEIAATWEYNDTSLDALATQIVTSQTGDRTWVSFHLDREPDSHWPAGAYEVTVSMNGAETQQATVEVISQE